jgi:hypothetical protein
MYSYKAIRKGVYGYGNHSEMGTTVLTTLVGKKSVIIYSSPSVCGQGPVYHIPLGPVSMYHYNGAQGKLVRRWFRVLVNHPV